MWEEEEIKNDDEKDKKKIVELGDSSFDSSLLGLKQDSVLLRAMNWDNFAKIELNVSSEKDEQQVIS